MADGLTAEPEHFEIDAPEETPQDAQLSSSSSPKSKLEREGSRDVDAVNLKESARPALVAIGDALLEMTASVGELYIERYGLQKNRHVLGDETHIPLFRDLWEHHTPELCNTGSTQTAIRCCQALLDTPYAAAVICSVGNDQFAQAMEELNDAEEVLSLFVRIPEKPTGMSAALCNNNERAQVTNLAANNDFPLDHLRFKVWDYVEDSSICFASGLFLTACPPALLVLAQHCAKAGKPFCLDLAAPFVVEFYLEGLRSLIPYCDYIFASEAELSMYARAMHMNPEGGSESRHHGSSSNSAGGHGGAFGTQGALSLEDIAARLASSPKANVDSRRFVILTRGSAPTIVASSWCGYGIKIESFPVEPLDRSRILDSEGVGDCFVGGFLAGLTQGYNTDRCIRLAHYAARWKLQRLGSRFDFHDKPLETDD